MNHHEGCCDPVKGCGEEFGCECRDCEYYDRCCCECQCSRQSKLRSHYPLHLGQQIAMESHLPTDIQRRVDEIR